MKKILKALLVAVSAIYPILIFTLLVIFKVDIKILSLCIIVLAGTSFISATGLKKTDQKDKVRFDWKPFLSSLLFLSVGLFCFFTEKEFFLRIYSVIINVTMLFVFGITLFTPPNMIFRFATLSDKSIKGSPDEDRIYNYCKIVTIIWCCFFILNGTIAAITTFSDKIFGVSPETARTIWAVYNGGISYILMGTLFFGEMIVRRIIKKRWEKE